MADLELNTKNKGLVKFKEKPVDGSDLDKLREHVKNVSDIINQASISQAFALYTIFKSGVWQSQWGFMTWRDYIATEAGISHHRDERLRRMAKVFQFLNIDQADLEEIGYHKAFLLIALAGKKYSCITVDNIGKWMKYANLEGCTSRVLEFAVEEAKIVKQENPGLTMIDPPSSLMTPKDKTEKNAVEASTGSVKEEGDKESVESNEDKEDSSLVLNGSVASLDEDENPSVVLDGQTDENGVYVEEQSFTSTNHPSIAIVEQVKLDYKVYPDQKNLIEAAIDKAKQSSGYEAPGHLLELICAEYLAGATVEFAASDKYLGFICDSLSKVHGGKFVHYPDGQDPQVKVFESSHKDDHDPDGEIPF